MKFCTACGTELKNGNQFCTECGAKQHAPVPETPEAKIDPINQETTKAYTPMQQPEPIEQQQPVTRSKSKAVRKPVSVGMKVFLGIAAGLVILLLGTHFWLSSYFDPMKNLEALNDAILDNDSAAFFNKLEWDKQVLLDEESYFQYIKNEEWSSVREQFLHLLKLQNQDASRYHKTIESSYGADLFTVTPESHVFGLYTTYTFKAEPTELVVLTNIDETEVIIDTFSQTINANKTEAIKIYPGTYALEGYAKNMFGEFFFDEDISVTSGGTEADIIFDFHKHLVDTNKWDATLFINGKSTGKELGDFYELGPFPEDVDIMSIVHAEWVNPDGKTVKAEHFRTYSGSLYFEFDEEEMYGQETAATTEHDLTDASELVFQFRDAYEVALNTKDFSLIAPFLKNGSEVDEELKIYIGDLEDAGYHYEFTDNVILDIKQIDEDIVEVTTNELFIFTNHLDDQIDYDREKVYTLTSEDGDFQITKIEYKETNRDKR